jgi:hypothetical protein
MAYRINRFAAFILPWFTVFTSSTTCILKNCQRRDHINGVKFILFRQSIERFQGGFDKPSNDYLFFFHSF